MQADISNQVLSNIKKSGGLVFQDRLTAFIGSVYISFGLAAVLWTIASLLLNLPSYFYCIKRLYKTCAISARVVVAFPGGFGTLDELFEVLTLVQTRKARPVPIVLFGRNYWSRLLNLDMLVDEGAIAPEDLALYEVVDTPEEAWEVIRAFYRL